MDILNINLFPTEILILLGPKGSKTEEGFHKNPFARIPWNILPNTCSFNVITLEMIMLQFHHAQSLCFHCSPRKLKIPKLFIISWLPSPYESAQFLILLTPTHPLPHTPFLSFLWNSWFVISKVHCILSLLTEHNLYFFLWELAVAWEYLFPVAFSNADVLFPFLSLGLRVG